MAVEHPVTDAIGNELDIPSLRHPRLRRDVLRVRTKSVLVERDRLLELIAGGELREMQEVRCAEADMEAVAKRTEEEHAKLAAAIETAFVPVTHTITVTAE